MKWDIIIDIMAGLLIAFAICYYLVAIVAIAYFIGTIILWDSYLMLVSFSIVTGALFLGAICSESAKSLYLLSIKSIEEQEHEE